MTKQATLLNGLTKAALIIEIGPSYNLLAPKRGRLERLHD